MQTRPLVSACVLILSLRAQQRAPALKLVVLDGEGATNNVRTRSATQPVVEVRDQTEMPVAGAEVTFELPEFGPGGSFPGSERAQTARTNTQGQAATRGFAPNTEVGRFRIKVTARLGGAAGSVFITQRNATREAPRVRSGGSRWWKVLSVIGGGAAAGAILMARSSGGKPSPQPPGNTLVIVPGPVTVGAPR